MRRALVVGINDYMGAPLAGCVNDASAVATILETHGDGSPNFGVRLITAPSSSISRGELREAIDKLFADVCDIALFYFSGHGLIKSTGGYIITPDYKKYDEGISMDEILVLANNSRARDRVILLDCCHSGAFGSPALSGSNTAQLAEGLSVMTASRSSESAFEVNGSGVFTSLVTEALKGGAADLRGHVTPGGVYSYVDRALGPWDQRPIFKTNVTRFTSLRQVSPPIPLATLRKLCVYFPHASDEYRLDPSHESTSPSADPANVQTMKDLQKFVSVGLVVPVAEEHMYFAAMNSRSCRLTALGYHYWRLAHEKKI
ncbi:caspase family protein [Sorangium atrum]|uniref:Caspase family protein n=1 Tax=Sorangium atrum TaxID=2995308 RepID=A0ABT5C543_9BACT|nr:caspase family protein [Sorangium aterium]MDC0681541.1 caspase family protein [Sorangium aterium]